MGTRLKLFLAQLIISVNQLSIYGAVSDVCEEYKACHVRTARPVLAGKSDPLFVQMKTPTPSTEDPAQEDLLHRYQERVERLFQQNRVAEICNDSGFLKTLKSDSTSWQSTLTSFHNSQNQWHVVSTLCQEMKQLSDPKGWILRGNTIIGPRVGSHNLLPTRQIGSGN